MKILQGAKKTLLKTKFVSVDHSAEKGFNKSKKQHLKSLQFYLKKALHQYLHQNIEI